MKYRALATLLVVMGLSVMYSANALAAHSPWHRGACAASNSTVAGGVEDLVVRGNANVTAQFMGYNLVNGSAGWQLRHGLVMAVSASTFTASNTGCSGGRHFVAKNRVIEKFERVAIRRPSYINPRQVCAPYAHGCKRITVWTGRLLPSSCWNGDMSLSGPKPFWIWLRPVPVKAPPKHHPKPKTKPAPKGTVVCIYKGVKQYAQPSGTYIDSSGNCVDQTNTAEQSCTDKGGTWDSQKQLCTIIQTNGNCSNIVIVNGSGNTVSVTQQGNCNNNPPPSSSPPPQSATYNVSCSGALTSNKDNTEIRWTANASATNGVSVSSYSWSSGGSGSSTTVDYQSQYNASVQDTVSVTFSDGHSQSYTCSRTTGSNPNPPPKGSGG